VLQKAPVIYQDNRPIRGRYTLLAHNQVGFRLDRYDRTRPLVIDPILVYCAYMGSSGNDRITAMKMGPNGQLYITGSTPTSEMPYIDGAYDNFNAGLIDIFLAIIDTTDGNFTLKYFSYLGGANNDKPTGPGGGFRGRRLPRRIPPPRPISRWRATRIRPPAPPPHDGIRRHHRPQPLRRRFADLLHLPRRHRWANHHQRHGARQRGFIYLIGTTRATDFPFTDNAYAQDALRQPGRLPHQARSQQHFPALLHLSGRRTTDEGRSIAVGTDGKVYFGITTASTDFPLEGPSYSKRRTPTPRRPCHRRHDGHDQIRRSFAGLLHLFRRLR
jgi:hypothetical protein